jgi:hypothetical protein
MAAGMVAAAIRRLPARERAVLNILLVWQW